MAIRLGNLAFGTGPSKVAHTTFDIPITCPASMANGSFFVSTAPRVVSSTDTAVVKDELRVGHPVASQARGTIPKADTTLVQIAVVSVADTTVVLVTVVPVAYTAIILHRGSVGHLVAVPALVVSSADVALVKHQGTTNGSVAVDALPQLFVTFPCRIGSTIDGFPTIVRLYFRLWFAYILSERQRENDGRQQQQILHYGIPREVVSRMSRKKFGSPPFLFGIY
jgi:hypothetical protein